MTNGVWLSMLWGFNLNMRASNSLVTAGRGPMREWIHGEPGQFKCPECHCRGDEVSVKETLVRDNDIPKQRWCKASKSGVRVCVCVFLLLVKVRPEGSATPQINGVAITGSVTDTLNWHDCFRGELFSWSEGGLPQLWVFSELVIHAQSSINQTLSRFNAMDPLCLSTRLSRIT